MTELTREAMAQRDALSRMAELEEENRQLTSRAIHAEQRLGRVAQSYAAVTELHGAETGEEVMTVLKEIVANLIGCEEMGLYDVWVPGPILSYADGIALDAQQFRRLPSDHPLVAEALISGDLQLPDPAHGTPGINGLPVTAVLPLRQDGEVAGLIVLFRLVRQKPVLDGDDLELLRVVARHAARALTAARRQEGDL
ncbi:MAG: GAF domain-containing protein [Gemmatimonadales bacterium]